MKYYLSLVVFTLAVFISSCKKDEAVSVNQDNVYTEYELFYHGDEDKSYAKVKFKNGSGTGATLKLNSPSSISFNDESLIYNEALSVYEFAFDGLVTEGTFKYKDANDRIFTNTVSLPIIKFPALDTITRSSDFLFNWEGEALKLNESVILILTGENGGMPQFISIKGEGKTSEIIPKSDLFAIKAGIGNVLLERTYLPELINKTSCGGTITGKYRDKIRTIYFK